MEHYYVVTGNAYGADLNTKRNFSNYALAEEHYEQVVFDEFACVLIHVDGEGNEKILKCNFAE